MSDAQQRIDTLVKTNEVVLFMKGNASFPQCGFSGSAATPALLEDDPLRR